MDNNAPSLLTQGMKDLKMNMETSSGEVRIRFKTLNRQKAADFKSVTMQDATNELSTIRTQRRLKSQLSKVISVRNCAESELVH